MKRVAVFAKENCRVQYPNICISSLYMMWVQQVLYDELPDASPKAFPS